MNAPLFSVITVCLNAERFIADTLLSVKRQTYPNVEHIIIDGGSTDNTLSVVNEHPERVTVKVSERDLGIYDAMNKGIARSSGVFLLFLNADDYLTDEHVLEDVVRELQSSPGVDLLYGGVDQLDPDDGYRSLHQMSFSMRELRTGEHPPHQACFFSRDSLRDFEGYVLNYRVCGDFELLLRYFSSNRNIQYIDRTISVFRMTGYGSTLRSSFLPIRERFTLLKAHFGRGTASRFWLRSRLTLLRKSIRAALQRSGMLTHWRLIKSALNKRED